MGVHLLDPFLTNFGCEHRAEPIPPKPNRLMTDIDAPLVKQVFDISKRKRKTHIHHHSQTDDFGRGFEIAKRGAFFHPQMLRNRPALFKSVSSDTAFPHVSHVVNASVQPQSGVNDQNVPVLSWVIITVFPF
jgi:hypothetical protein